MSCINRRSVEGRRLVASCATAFAAAIARYFVRQRPSNQDQWFCAWRIEQRGVNWTYGDGRCRNRRYFF